MVHIKIKHMTTIGYKLGEKKTETHHHKVPIYIYKLALTFKMWGISHKYDFQLSFKNLKS